MGLSYAQLEGLWIQAGGSAATAPVAAAIALAESGGNPNSYNGNTGTGDNSYGLWQINMIGSMGPARLKEFGLTSDTQLFDPLTNAKAAVIVANGGSNFSPWTTYTHGAYEKYLQNGVTPNVTGISGAGGAVGNTGGTAASAAASLNPITDIESAVTGTVYWVGNYSFIFACVTMGMLIVGIGVFLMTTDKGTLTGAAKKGLLMTTGYGKVTSMVADKARQNRSSKRRAAREQESQNKQRAADQAKQAKQVQTQGGP